DHERVYRCSECGKLDHGQCHCDAERCAYPEPDGDFIGGSPGMAEELVEIRVDMCDYRRWCGEDYDRDREYPDRRLPQRHNSDHHRRSDKCGADPWAHATAPAHCGIADSARCRCSYSLRVWLCISAA